MPSPLQNFTLIRSRRRTIAIQIDENLQVTVRAPYRMSDQAIQKFLQEKSPWIEKHMRKLQSRLGETSLQPENMLTAQEIRGLAEEARAYIPQRAAYFASLLGVDYGRITIRCQKTRWGSCSSKGNLNFNCLLMLTPPEIIDYVTAHELCHRLQMNHSEKFWREVESVIPDYKTRRKWLRENGNAIMRRAGGG